MGRERKGEDHRDRFLVLRGGKYQYVRRVPADVAHLDKRAPHIRKSLRTGDLAVARAIRDIHERSDNELWASLTVGGHDDPWAKHEAAQRLARAMGFDYRPARSLASGGIDDIIRRLESPSAVPTAAPAAAAILGAVGEPTISISKAFEVYLDKIVPHELTGKSAAQKKRWEGNRRASIDHFIEVVGDLDIRTVSRADARRYYDFWMERIAPKEGVPTHTFNIGNRRLAHLGGLYKAYFGYLQEMDRANPFDGLRFKKQGTRLRKRPSFSVKWLTDVVLKPGALAGMNAEARAIFLVVANTGARPSEIANLRADRIVLGHEVPHIRIEPDEDPDDPREIKTASSIRIVPLVGLALEAMKKFSAGFPRYRDKGDSLSGALNKYLGENGLLESERHTVYSLRHSFEDRMKDAKVDAELRRILMGHSIDRPEYGEGGSLKLRQEAMTSVALPFDPSIV